MKFREYILSRPITDDPVGDFAFDAKRDHGNFPDVDNFEQLFGYLVYQKGCGYGVSAIAEEAWQEYLIRDILPPLKADEEASRQESRRRPFQLHVDRPYIPKAEQCLPEQFR